MNALRILLLIILLLYLAYVHPKYFLYFFSIFIPYIIITQYAFFNSALNTVKTKVFISSWSHAYDPSIYGLIKLNITKLKKFCKEYSEKTGVKVGLTTYLIKLGGIILKKFPDLNGNIFLGKFVPRDSYDISILFATDKSEESEIITIRDANILSLEQISKQVASMKEKLLNQNDEIHNRRLTIAKLVPTL